MIKTTTPLEEPIQTAPIRVPTLKDMVSVLLKSQPDEAEKVAQYADKLSSLIGNHEIGRMDIVLILSASMEPCEARDTELGHLFPNLIPLRTIQDAWGIVTAHEKTLRGCVKIFARGNRSMAEKRSDMIINFVEAALYWDPAQKVFPAYVKSQARESSRERRQRSLIPNQEDGTDLFYGGDVKDDDYRSNRITRQSTVLKDVVHRPVEDADTADKIRKAVRALSPRHGNVLSMRFGFGEPPDFALSHKADWDRHPTTAFRVRLEEARVLKKFAERKIPYFKGNVKPEKGRVRATTG